jgi:hypothetical protein
MPNLLMCLAILFPRQGSQFMLLQFILENQHLCEYLKSSSLLGYWVIGLGSPVRVSQKALVDFIFIRALEVATQRGIPMQIHTGFGDKDLQLELANPLHLRAVLEHSTFVQSRVVLLHGSYPFMREASYLAGVYPQVHLDFGLVVPKLSVRGMRCAVSDLLDLAPVNKVRVLSGTSPISSYHAE